MSGVRDIVTISFAVILFIFLVYISFQLFINPYKDRSSFMELDSAVAMYIDTLSQVEEGRIKIPLEKEGIGTVESVEIKYETRGRKGDYKVSKEGWYVVVSYGFTTSSTQGAARINSYGTESGTEVTLYRPENICIRKSEELDWAVVEKC
jgi:hypothetical protein